MRVLFSTFKWAVIVQTYFVSYLGHTTYATTPPGGLEVPSAEEHMESSCVNKVLDQKIEAILFETIWPGRNEYLAKKKEYTDKARQFYDGRTYSSATPLVGLQREIYVAKWREWEDGRCVNMLRPFVREEYNPSLWRTVYRRFPGALKGLNEVEMNNVIKNYQYHAKSSEWNLYWLGILTGHETNYLELPNLMVQNLSTQDYYIKKAKLYRSGYRSWYAEWGKQKQVVTIANGLERLNAEIAEMAKIVELPKAYGIRWPLEKYASEETELRKILALLKKNEMLCAPQWDYTHSLTLDRINRTEFKHDCSKITAWRAWIQKKLVSHRYSERVVSISSLWL